MKCKAAMQTLQKAESIKSIISENEDLINDSEPWKNQQQLRSIYREVLLLDLEYALDKKVEQELWTLGFKNHINLLQEMARDLKHTQRNDAQNLLSWTLQTAFGFYTSLLQEFCTLYNLDMPFRKLLIDYEPVTLSKEINMNKEKGTKSSSCLYMCQHCLVHLGDIARYQNHRKQAETYYKYSIEISPSSGQPYNQLALLEASEGDKLATVYYYVRGIAVKNPFPAAISNLTKTLSTIIEKEDKKEVAIQTKMNVNECLKKFLKVHAFLLFATELKQVEIIVKSINATLTALIATESFTKEQLIRMVVVNLYQLKRLEKNEQALTEEEKQIGNYVLELLAGSLSAFLLPVYTLKQDESLLDYYALPALILIMYWIEKEPHVLQETVFTNWPQIWPSLCKLLNSLQKLIVNFDGNEWEKMLLKEDRELQGFLPLFDVIKGRKSKEICAEKEKFVRAKRLLKCGDWLTDLGVINNKNNKDGGSEMNLFEPKFIQPDPTSKLLEEMKSFNITQKEKRGGILKPQGSLEKAREEREQQQHQHQKEEFEKESTPTPRLISNLKSDSSKQKRVRQNVALQSIFKKIEENNKQVKFNVENEEEEKSNEDNNVKNVVQIIKEKKIESDQSAPSVPLSLPLPLPPIQNDTFWYLNNQYTYFPSAGYENNSSKFFNDFQHQQQPQQQPPTMSYNNNNNNNNNRQQSNFPYSHHHHHHQQQAAQQQQPQQQHYPQFSGMWKSDSQQIPPWSNWPNSNQNQQQENYQLGYQYQSNMPYSFNNNFHKKQEATMPSNSPWNPPQQPQQQMPPPMQQQSLSLRQAMLKEAKGGGVTASVVPPSPPGVGGYSLFNPGGWSPNFAGQQYRSAVVPPSEVLFAAPQSLQQLLDQQNNKFKGNS